MKSGIYKITNTVNQKVYIGQSVDVFRRLTHHKHELTLNKHRNDYIQHSVNKYGLENFTFEILEFCEVEELDEKEIYYINQYNSTNKDYGYNIQSGGHLGHCWNIDARNRRCGSGNPMFGKHQSIRTIEAIRLANRASSDKLTEEDVKYIKQSLFKEAKSISELAEDFNVDFTTIHKIRSCDNWSWVLPELNDYLKNIEQIKKAKKLEAFKKLHLEGKSNMEIADITGWSYSAVASNIRKLFPDESKQKDEEKQRLIESIRNDFKSGFDTMEIAVRNNISANVVRRYVKDLRAEAKEDLIFTVKKLRAEGMYVKDIAKKLGLNRCTVTEYCKK